MPIDKESLKTDLRRFIIVIDKALYDELTPNQLSFLNNHSIVCVSAENDYDSNPFDNIFQQLNLQYQLPRSNNYLPRKRCLYLGINKFYLYWATQIGMPEFSVVTKCDQAKLGAQCQDLLSQVAALQQAVQPLLAAKDRPLDDRKKALIFKFLSDVERPLQTIVSIESDLNKSLPNHLVKQVQSILQLLTQYNDTIKRCITHAKGSVSYNLLGIMAAGTSPLPDLTATLNQLKISYQHYYVTVLTEQIIDHCFYHALCHPPETAPTAQLSHNVNFMQQQAYAYLADPRGFLSLALLTDAASSDRMICYRLAYVLTDDQAARQLIYKQLTTAISDHNNNASTPNPLYEQFWQVVCQHAKDQNNADRLQRIADMSHIKQQDADDTSASAAGLLQVGSASMPLEQIKRKATDLLSAEQLYKQDKGCVIMLHLASFIRESEWEGGKTLDALNYYRTILASPAWPLPLSENQQALTIAQETIAELLYFYQAFQTIHTQGYQSTAILELTREIQQRCASKGSCYLPSGYTGRKSGYFAAVKIRLLPNGHYAFSVLDQGDGMRFHRPIAKHGSKPKRDYQSLEYAIDLNTQMGPEVLVGIIKLQFDQRIYDENEKVIETPGRRPGKIVKNYIRSNCRILVPYSADDLYGLFITSGKLLEPGPTKNKAVTPQRSGSCIMTNTKCAVEDALLTRAELSANACKRFQFVIKLSSLIEDFKSDCSHPAYQHISASILREYDTRIIKHDTELLSPDEIVLCTEIAAQIHTRLTLERAKILDEQCARKPLPSLQGEFTKQVQQQQVSQPSHHEDSQPVQPPKQAPDKLMN